MKRWVIVSVVMLSLSGLSGAAVIDNFDALGPNGAYTTTTPAVGQAVENVAVGWSTLAPVAGNGLGWALPEAKQTYCMMRSDVTFNMGDSLDVWVEPGPYGGGGVAVEFNDGATTGYYVVALGNMGGNHSLIVRAHDGFSSGGSPIAYTNAGDVPGHTPKYQGPNTIPDGQWYHIIATIDIAGADVQIDATVNSGTPGSETLVDSTTYVDVGMAGSTTLSNVGLALSEWSSTGPDFDDLSYIGIPEPASLILLGLGGVALLRRRR